jgi:hypothetical protein
MASVLMFPEWDKGRQGVGPRFLGYIYVHKTASAFL